MRRTSFWAITLLVLSAAAFADDARQALGAKAQAVKTAATKAPVAKAPAAKTDAAADQEGKPEGDVQMSGMSVLGNDEAPKSLVIVPWKSSQLGAMPSLSKLLDDSTQPVDKDVFMRELAYYQIKAHSK
jgi:hypothetical protein